MSAATLTAPADDLRHLWPQHTTAREHEAAAAEQFARDTADHQIVVHHDVDGYRHLRMAKPSGSEFWYDVITTPGVDGRPGTLTIRGDMGAFTFERLPDMFEFFRHDRINPAYWAQKLTSGEAREYSMDSMVELVADYVSDMREDYSEEEYASLVSSASRIFAFAETETEAREALSSFEFDGHEISDGWELDPRRFSYHYLWCCHAIIAAVAAYDARNA